MKYKISLSSFEVSEFTKEDEAGCRSNGQHYQLPGHAIACMEILTCRINIALLHPETQPSTGHYDVMIECTAHRSLFFRIYSNSERVRLCDDTLNHYWPSGQRSLVRVALALDEYLERRGFRLGIWNEVVVRLDS